jgi:hypothetical protein
VKVVLLDKIGVDFAYSTSVRNCEVKIVALKKKGQKNKYLYAGKK